MVEDPQDDKALALPARLGAVPYTIFVTNQYAARMHRQDFISAIVKQCPGFFDENKKEQEISKAAEIMYEEVEAAWIKKHCGEYEMPCFDFDISAADLEWAYLIACWR